MFMMAFPCYHNDLVNKCWSYLQYQIRLKQQVGMVLEYNPNFNMSWIKHYYYYYYYYCYVNKFYIDY